MNDIELSSLFPPERTITISRTFSAPLDLVWAVWTQPEHIAQWWGPRGFTTRVKAMDFRVGGLSEYVMVGPDGTEYPVQGRFLEIVPKLKIVSTDEFGEDFPTVTGQELPTGIVLTVEFAETAGQTQMTMRIVHPTVDAKQKHENMGVVLGWQSSFDCMDDHLASLLAK